jgi:hypothetical protein
MNIDLNRLILIYGKLSNDQAKLVRDFSARIIGTRNGGPSIVTEDCIDDKVAEFYSAIWNKMNLEAREFVEMLQSIWLSGDHLKWNERDIKMFARMLESAPAAEDPVAVKALKTVADKTEINYVSTQPHKLYSWETTISCGCRHVCVDGVTTTTVCNDCKSGKTTATAYYPVEFKSIPSKDKTLSELMALENRDDILKGIDEMSVHSRSEVLADIVYFLKHVNRISK